MATTAPVGWAPEDLRHRVSAMSSVKASLLVLGVLLPVYLLTASYDYRVSVDTALAAMPAWNLVENGTLDLSEHRDHLEARELGLQNTAETATGLYSNRSGGVILVGAVFYGLFAPFIGPQMPFPMYPAAIAAAFTSALAIAVLHLVFRRLVGPFEALVAAFVVGFATSTWSVSADALWSHGPAQLFIAIGMLELARRRYETAGLALGIALFVRPYVAIAAAASGVWEAIERRRIWPVLRVGATAVLGLLVLLAYNRWLYGDGAGIAGGYARHGYVGNAADLGSRPWGGAALNLLGAFFHPERGMLWYSPFLFVLVPGLRHAWREAPSWVQGSALGGLAVLLAQYWVQNQSQGGDLFFGYRYGIEPLTLAAPLLVLAWRDWVAVTPMRRRVFRILAVVSVALQAFGAIFEPHTWG